MRFSNLITAAFVGLAAANPIVLTPKDTPWNTTLAASKVTALNTTLTKRWGESTCTMECSSKYSVFYTKYTVRGEACDEGEGGSHIHKVARDGCFGGLTWWKWHGVPDPVHQPDTWQATFHCPLAQGWHLDAHFKKELGADTTCWR